MSDLFGDATPPKPADDERIVQALPGGFGRQKPGWFERLSKGLGKSSTRLADQVASVLTKKRLDHDDLEKLEELLIEADVGSGAAARIAQAFGRARFDKESTEHEVKESLADALAAELSPFEGRFQPLSGPRPFVVLFVGVNGSGKTTTLGKIACELKARGAKVLIAAGDTFRAAAVEQLRVWADRANARFLSRGPGADAAGLAFDAVTEARADGIDVVLIDTAGRLQNKSGLMDELAKIVRVLKKIDSSLPHETLLVLDATVGRNGLSQAKEFAVTSQVTGIVMTKLDGTARGGVLLAAAEAGRAPIKLIGVGEQADDLQPFHARAFARSLVGLEEA